MSIPSSIWASLASPYSPAGSIPFVYLDGVIIATSVLQLYWNQTSNLLSVGTTGDVGGTDTINIYKQLDAYLPTSQQAAVSGVAGVPPTVVTLSASSVMNGLSLSSSGGTGAAPSSNVTGDLIGIVTAWSYQTSAYTPLAAEFFFARGGTAGNLGGEIQWATKANGATPLVSRVTLDNAGNFYPTSASLTLFTASATLGLLGNPWLLLRLMYANAAATGNVVQNTACGSVQIAAGQVSVICSNSLVTANSVVHATLNTVDASAKSVVAVGSIGQIVFSLTPAAATGTCRVSYLVLPTDS